MRPYFAHTVPSAHEGDEDDYGPVTISAGYHADEDAHVVLMTDADESRDRLLLPHEALKIAAALTLAAEAAIAKDNS